MIRVQPSPSPPFAISETWLTSETYVGAIRADITALVSLFAQHWSSYLETKAGQSETTAIHAVDRNGAHEPILYIDGLKRTTSRKGKNVIRTGSSVFAAFRQCWDELGWDRVHVSLVDDSLRQEWFRIMTRLFLDQMTATQTHDLHKAGALLGLYTLWASQSQCSRQEGVTVDLATLARIEALPTRVAHAVDGALVKGDLEMELKPSDDLFMAVHLMHHASMGTAFILAPTIACHNPRLPSNGLEAVPSLAPPIDEVVGGARKRARISVTPSKTPGPPAFTESIAKESDPSAVLAFEWMPTAEGSSTRGGPLDASNLIPARLSTGLVEASDTSQMPTVDVQETTGDPWATAPGSLTQEEVNELLLRGLQSPAARIASAVDDAADEDLLGVSGLTGGERTVTEADDAYLNFPGDA